jgi:23S rRNA (cytosine1962-C5)-methyltransferase
MSTGEKDDLYLRLDSALHLRAELLDAEHSSALRLFNGLIEGGPQVVVDLYARSLVLFGYAESEGESLSQMDAAQSFCLKRLPWITCVVQKVRDSSNPELRRGRISYGERPDEHIRENGVMYALDLLMNQDASFYLDTRLLRLWLLEQAAGWEVLNAFAYTGSLGIAALAGGARRVVQVDRSLKFLSLARRSAMLNRLDLGRLKQKASDFFNQVADFKRREELFDCAILDPPFFSSTRYGKVDLQTESSRLINRLRPLVRDGGRLVAINNALFVSGADYLASLEKLCQDGYLQIESLVPVPPDVAGFSANPGSVYPADPNPFNHPTKIAILRVRRKQQTSGRTG